MTIGIQGCMNQTSQSRDLAAPRPQKSAKKRKKTQKNAKKQQFFTFLTTASYQTAGRTAFGRTSAEPAWDGQ